MRKSLPITLILSAILIVVGLLWHFIIGRPPYNLLLISVDTLRSDALGSYGNPSTYTPTTNRLSSMGTTFYNAYTHVPITAPSFSTIFTSKYPLQHGVLNNDYDLNLSYTTLAETLHEQGYSTGAVISTHVLDGRFGFSQGFDYFNDQFYYRPAEKTTQRAIEWLKRLSGSKIKQPFFLWVHYIDPHSPYKVPDSPYRKLYLDEPLPPEIEGMGAELCQIYVEKLKLTPYVTQIYRNLYYQEVSYCDFHIGKILSFITERGLLNRTLIVFHADHGEVLYEHDYYFGHAFSLNEGSIRIPMTFILPGIIPQGKILEDNVQTIDIMPTILDILGIKPRLKLEGISLLSAILGKGNLPQRSILSQTYQPEGEYDKDALIAYGYKLIIEPEHQIEKLYNLFSDAQEISNLIEIEEKKARQLKTILQDELSRLPSRESHKRPKVDRWRLDLLRSMGYAH